MAPHTPPTLGRARNPSGPDTSVAAPPRNSALQARAVAAGPFSRKRSATATCIAMPLASADSFTSIRGDWSGNAGSVSGRVLRPAIVPATRWRPYEQSSLATTPPPPPCPPPPPTPPPHVPPAHP